MMTEPKATICSIIAGVGSNYRIMPDIFRDNRRLPNKTMDRYCFDTQIGCARFYCETYRTKADVDREREAAEALIPKVSVEIKGNLKWTFDEALEYLQEKANGKQPFEWLKGKDVEEQRKSNQFQKEVRKIKSEAATEKRKQKRKPRLTIEEIYYATMAKAGRELPKPTKSKPVDPPNPAPPHREADPFAFDRQWVSAEPAQPRFVRSTSPTEQDAIDEQYRKTLARRERQKVAMDSGMAFSTPQRGYGAGIITWPDPDITDVRLVRLVLGPDRGSREMTEEEKNDYWHWKARGK